MGGCWERYWDKRVLGGETWRERTEVAGEMMGEEAGREKLD